eukprot:UN27581
MGSLWNFRLQSVGLLVITYAARKYKKQEAGYRIWKEKRFCQIVMAAGIVFNFQSKLMWFGGFFAVVLETARDRLLTLEDMTFKRYLKVLSVERWGDQLKKSVENERRRFLKVCSMGSLGLAKAICLGMWGMATADCMQSIAASFTEAPLVTFSLWIPFFIFYMNLYVTVWDTQPNIVEPIEDLCLVFPVVNVLFGEEKFANACFSAVFYVGGVGY